MVIIIFFLDTENLRMYVIFWVNVEMHLLMRVVIICNKYATLHPVRIQKYCHHILSKDDFSSDLTLAGWFEQSDFIIYKEYSNALKRK